MIIIGTKATGEFIVEMSIGEIEELSRLAKAIEGSSGVDYLRVPGSKTIFPDLSTTFGNIRMWYTAKFNLNRMKEIFEDIENQMRGKDGTQE